MSWQVPDGRHEDEGGHRDARGPDAGAPGSGGPGRRALVGFDARPTLVVRADDPVAARTFPATEVRRAGEVARTGARDVGYTVALLALFMATANTSTIARWLGAAGEGWVSTAIGTVCVVSLVVLIVVNLVRLATWQMFVAGALLALVGGIVTQDSISNTYVFPVVLLAIAVPVRRSRLLRQGRWRAIKPIMSDHVLVEGTVIDAVRSRSTGAGAVNTIVLTVASPSAPGRSWSAQMTVPDTEVDHAPDVGDPISVFVCPGSPEVAVLRPVLAARTPRG